jgi:mevalonate kinase
MSPEAAVSVPGKAILLGEHAAVYGYPALVTAVDLRLTVTARATGDGRITVDGPSEFRTGAMSAAEAMGLSRGAEAPGDRLAYLACGAALAHADAPAVTGLALRIASDIPPGSGLGSSAALSVGVVAAVFTALGLRVAAETIAEVAKRVEARQHGRPSGVDVEAVLRGGTLWCRRSAEGTLACTPLPGAQAGLTRLELYHTGAPAESTGEMVAAVGFLRERDPRRVNGALASIEAAALAARDALAAGHEADRALLPLISRAEAALESLEVVPNDVARAIRAIEAQGGAAKVSGAGGRAAGGGLVLVLPAPGGAATVPSHWRRLHARLGAPGLLEDVAA